MALRARDVLIAAFVAFVAWGFLISWAPILRFLGYAFTAGALSTILLLTALVLFTSEGKVGSDYGASAKPRTAAFLAPKTWQEETEWLSGTAIYRRTPLYPPSFMISDSLDGLLQWILRDYVVSWYSNISQSSNFVNEMERSIRTALINIRDSIFDVDVVEVAVSRIVPIITAHLKEFYEAERAVRGKNLNRNVTESTELDLAIAAKYRDGKLHPASSLAYADLKLIQQEYLRRIIVRLLPDILPDVMIKSRAVSVLIKEIVSCAVLAPLMQIMSDPDTWNQLMQAYGQTMLEDRKTVRKLRAALDQHASPTPKASKPHAFPRIASGDDERKFERFVRSIRQCNNLSEARRYRSEVASQLKRESMLEDRDQIYIRRLETGKHLLDQRVGKLSAVGGTSGSRMPQPDFRNGQTTSRLLSASIIDVLHDATGLSYFMEYMDRQRLMTYVQFWIVVDGFRNPLEQDIQAEDPFSGGQTHWSESDRADIAQISEAYLSRPELKVPEESKSAVRSFLKTGKSATMLQYLRARSAVLRAQSSVLQEMNEIHFLNFKKSDLFYKYLTSDDAAGKPPPPPRPAVRALKHPSVASIPESPSRPPPLSRLLSRPNASNPDLRRNTAASGDSKVSGSATTDDVQAPPRRSLDIDTSAPLFDDDIDDERMSRSVQSLDNESISGDQAADDQTEVVEAVEAALNHILTDDLMGDDLKDPNFDTSDSHFLPKLTDSPRSSGEYNRTATDLSEKDNDKPSIASLGLVSTSSRIGVFTDDDLFGDEEKFLEDEKTDPELSADEKSVDDEIHEAAPGDLGLAEAISFLTADIERLAAQESVVDTLTRKAELTNNVAELRILSKSKSSLQRETRRKELQRQQYIVQESDNSLYGRANVRIKSIMVGKEDDGQEFALYVIEVQRKASENLAPASWAVARRYSEFHDLHQRLRHIYPAVRGLEFPRRRIVMKLQRDFLHKRRLALENYLRELLRMPAVCKSRDLRAFLSQSAIISGKKDSTREGERRDIISRIYNSVTDGMDEFLGNVPVLDQLSIAGQNLISAATSQFNTMQPTGSGAPLPIAPEDPIQTEEARAELLVFEPNAANTNRAEQLEPFVKPICDLFLEAFDLQRGNNWLRGRAVVVVLHQLLGGTVERKVREMVGSMLAEPSVLKYVNMLKDSMWPDGKLRKEAVVRTDQQKKQTRVEASVMLATLVPDMAGNVVGKANAQAASRRIFATMNNQRLNTHLAFTILDEVVDILFPKAGRGL
ncbi:Intermediate filament protein [Puttea exsequens]|nr:Intermediate filament protein [Puttea exsequens]